MTNKPDGMIPRFARSIDETDGDCDIIWTDRLSGEIIIRYDGADPANYAVSHGGVPDEEKLKSRGHSTDDEILLSQSKVHVGVHEIDMWKKMKEARAAKERDEDNAVDLMEFLGDEAAHFEYEHWYTGERDILKTALLRRGFTDIVFYMIEEDSFGPLVRGCRAYDVNCIRRCFIYS